MTFTKQRSNEIRDNWVQFDTLCYGTGWDEDDLKNPQILVEDVFGNSHPGSVHLDNLAEEVSIGIYQHGGKPAGFPAPPAVPVSGMSHPKPRSAGPLRR
jgi:dihydroxy-acid dehydratase